MHVDIRFPHHLANRLRHTNRSLANNNQRQQPHPLDQMRLLEAQHPPEAGNGDGAHALQEQHHPPYPIQPRPPRRPGPERQNHGAKHGRRHQVHRNVQPERQIQLRKPLPRHRHHHDRILQRQQTPTSHQHHAQHLIILIPAPALAHILIRLELAAHKRKADEHDELHDLAAALVHRVAREAHVVQRDLEPRRPQDGEEADVRRQRPAAVDRVVRREGRQVGHEEEVEAQLVWIRLVPLREDGVGVVGAYAWVFDEGHRAVRTLRGVVVVGFVAVGGG